MTLRRQGVIAACFFTAVFGRQFGGQDERDGATGPTGSPFSCHGHIDSRRSDRPWRMTTTKSYRGSDVSAREGPASAPSATSSACSAPLPWPAAVHAGEARNPGADFRATASVAARVSAPCWRAETATPLSVPVVSWSKTRIVKMAGKGLDAARLYLRYIQRDGVIREGTPGELYDAQRDRADRKAFIERSDGDRHQFRFIVTPRGRCRSAPVRLRW
jgi:hypothetical protein